MAAGRRQITVASVPQQGTNPEKCPPLMLLMLL
jgi:hypothetical protein